LPQIDLGLIGGLWCTVWTATQCVATATSSWEQQTRSVPQDCCNASV